MNLCLKLTFQTLQALNIEILDSLQMKASAIFSELPKLFFFFCYTVSITKYNNMSWQIPVPDFMTLT